MVGVCLCLVVFVRFLVGNGFVPLVFSSGFARGCSGFVFCLVHLAFVPLFLAHSCFVRFFRNLTFFLVGFSLLFLVIHKLPKILFTPSLINTCFAMVHCQQAFAGRQVEFPVCYSLFPSFVFTEGQNKVFPTNKGSC